MAPRAQLSVPTIGALPHSHRLSPTNPEVVRALSKLKRESLILLVLEWLDKKHRPFCRPYLYADHDHEDAENEDVPRDYDPAQSIEELQERWEELKTSKGSRKEIVERVLDGDWRRGISLYQLAMAETRHLLDNPNSLKWSAKLLAKVRSNSNLVDSDSSEDQLPRFHAKTFILNMAREIAPLMKTHFYITRIKAMDLTLLRVYLHDSPYNTEQSLRDAPAVVPGGSDTAKAVLVAFPDGSPFVYLSIATHMGQSVGMEGRSLRGLVIDAVPKALSKPSARYEFRDTRLSTRSLSTLLTLRGPGRGNAAAGGWSIFAENSFNQNALDFGIASPPKDVVTSNPSMADAAQDGVDKENSAPGTKRGRKETVSKGVQSPESPATKRRKQVAEGRFGKTGVDGDGMAIERLEVRIDDPFPASVVPAAEEQNLSTRPAAGKGKANSRRARPSLLDKPEEETANAPGADSENWHPDVRVTFYGSHVFAGIRQLAEQGIVDGEKMPGWMTGEAGVSIGVVKDGKIRTRKDGI